MSSTFNNEFPCTGCSLCCRNVGKIHSDALNYPKSSIVYQAAVSFPYFWDDAGCCVMLKNNLCSVYSSRPLLCNIKEISKEIARELNSDVRAVYALTAATCNKLISTYGLDPGFMIDLTQFD